eukprot:TRINITY_DN181_c1_g1_i1.p1 TRINITY_DN181_c1_g1~~TRINITY_DN181_c1_g1_i1.p1  ORF type:complete len:1111 (+),score=402.66 TRINITY_DN181_c1_g1_i1:110-3442(+)
MDADDRIDDVDLDEQDLAELEKNENEEDLPAQPAVEEPEEATTTEKARSERDRLKAVRLAQKRALEELRKEQNRQVSSDQDAHNRDRLNFLLQQTEIFTHFMSGKKTQNSSAGKGATKRGRRTEKEEDAEMLEDEATEEQLSDGVTAAAHAAGTRLTVQPSFITAGTMRDYQLHGLNWLIQLYESGINGILADEMGLGKTLQTISFLGYLKEYRGVSGPHLVITPKSTLGNWINEFRRWCPLLRVFKLHGSKDERARQRDEQLKAGAFDVCVTTYEVAIIEKAALRRFNWRYLVIDEAHRIKNEKSVLSQVVRIYSSQYRLLITGTPLQNNLHELWALLNFLLPEVFASAADFDAWFDLSGKDGQSGQSQRDVIEKLHKVLRPFLLRRLKHEVEHSLPPKREIKLFVGMSHMQKQWYTKILQRDLQLLAPARSGSGAPKKGSRDSRMRMLNIVMQLRKCCNHPYLFDGAEPQPYTNGEHLVHNAGKMDLLDKLLPKLKANGSRVLLFSQMTRVLDILEDYMAMRAWEYCRIDGSSQGDERDTAIEAYNAPGSSKFVFLLSTRAGGLGINLATADTVILFDSDWNPQVDLQAQDRAHRIGQTRPVTVFRLVTQGAIEEKVVERAEAKLHLDALVIQQGRLVEQNKALTHDEMLQMIHFGADEIFASADSTITDDDIDALIAKGEQRTEQMAAKLRQATKDVENLREFSLDSAMNMYEFQGVDYSQNKLSTTLSRGWIEPPKRERKGNYAVDQYYRDVMRASNEAKRAAPRPPKQPVIHEFQFYPKRLHELFDKEREAFLKRVSQSERADAAADANTADADAAAADFGDLTAEEVDDKEGLLQQGFSTWSRKEFNAFVRGSERYGRGAYAEIAEQEVQTKTEQEVRRYAKVFWQRIDELPDAERIKRNIEKGEARLARTAEMGRALEEKIKRYKDPERELRIAYSSSGGKGKAYTEEEDAFLVLTTHRLGYGLWDELKLEIRRSWQFRFDWFLKSRTPQELNRRVDTLIRCIEKENAEHEEKERARLKVQKQKESERKRKSAEIDKKKKDLEAKTAALKGSKKEKPGTEKPKQDQPGKKQKQEKELTEPEEPQEQEKTEKNVPLRKRRKVQS